MRAVVSRIGSWLLAGVATCAVATCHHDVPPVHQPPLREAPPLGSKPEHPHPLLFDELPGAVPAAVAPKTPPLDASVDGPIQLPPLPDAGPIIRDAATPMSR